LHFKSLPFVLDCEIEFPTQFYQGWIDLQTSPQEPSHSVSSNTLYLELITEPTIIRKTSETLGNKHIFPQAPNATPKAAR
jgi:hypothetical protein